MRPKAYSYLRMSTELQLKGDSRRRQLELSRRYAEEHELDLASEDQLEDIGISAFKGANVKEGSLGRFLEAVRAGSVEKDSYLLVESLDRLSRQPIMESLSLFLEIVRSGINLVTLTDGRVFRGGSTDFTDLIVTLTVMSRAHEESLIKSKRLSAVWKHKREKAASGQPMTHWAPAWLKLSKEKTSYEIVPERAQVVQRIFEDAASGIGMYSIAHHLNSEKVPTFSRSNGWHQSYIAKILANRAVLGEFQPGVRKDGVRVNEGDPIPNYFPAIVDEELFYSAQHGKDQRRGTSAGRKGAAFANLFSGLATCAYCQSKIIYENKGPGRKGGTYLICDTARRRLGCIATRWKYRDFEASFLAFVQELDLEVILTKTEDSTKQKEFEAELSALRGEIASVSKLMEQTYALLNAGSPVDFITKKLRELDTRQTDLAQRIATKEAEKKSFETREAQFYSSKDEIKELVTQLQGPANNELFKLRAQIASRLKGLVDTLVVAPLGAAPRMKKTIDELRTLQNGPEHEVLAYLMQVAEHPDQTRRYFAVGFRDAAVRAVFPAYNDPLHYEMQIETSQFGLHMLKE
ncbi:MAG: recombinase family protein [Bradyrhizobiaceae bacterium]|nr:MAG: recombinase family protein [Bradyrhizobiaceae bacterium]